MAILSNSGVPDKLISTGNPIDKANPPYDYAMGLPDKEWHYWCPNFTAYPTKCHNAFVLPHHKYCHQCGIRLEWVGEKPPLDKVFDRPLE